MGEEIGAISGRYYGESGEDSGVGTCGGDDGGSDGGSGGGTSIWNVNGATAGGFLTGENITWSSTTVISMERFSFYNIFVKTVEAPLSSCAISFWDLILVGGGDMGAIFCSSWQDGP